MAKRSTAHSASIKMITFSEKWLVSLVDIYVVCVSVANANDVAKVKCVQFFFFLLSFWCVVDFVLCESHKTSLKFHFVRSRCLIGTDSTYQFVHLPFDHKISFIFRVISAYATANVHIDSLCRAARQVTGHTLVFFNSIHVLIRLIFAAKSIWFSTK